MIQLGSWTQERMTMVGGQRDAEASKFCLERFANCIEGVTYSLFLLLEQPLQNCLSLAAQLSSDC
jgi:hypothetical protein